MLPVHGNRPYIVQNITPVLYNNQWWLKDSSDDLVQLLQNFSKLYNLLSVSGGQAMDIAVIGRENIFEPIGVWVNQQYIII